MKIWSEKVSVAVPDPSLTGSSFDESQCEIFICNVVEFDEGDEEHPPGTKTIKDGWVHFYDTVDGRLVAYGEIGYARSRILGEGDYEKLLAAAQAKQAAEKADAEG